MKFGRSQFAVKLDIDELINMYTENFYFYTSIFYSKLMVLQKGDKRIEFKLYKKFPNSYIYKIINTGVIDR